LIIKKRDSRDKDIAELTKLLSYKINAKQRLLIEKEIENIKKGEFGEKASEYYIDFYYI
jgi:hypothetical protein